MLYSSHLPYGPVINAESWGIVKPDIWMPRVYPEVPKAVDFSGRSVSTVLGYGGTQKDILKAISNKERGVDFFLNPGGSAQVLNFGAPNAIRDLVEKFGADKFDIDLSAPFPFEMKLEWTGSEVNAAIDVLKGLSPGNIPVSFGNVLQTPEFKPEAIGKWSFGAATNFADFANIKVDSKVLGLFKDPQNFSKLVTNLPTDLQNKAMDLVQGVGQITAASDFWGSGGGQVFSMAMSALADGTISIEEAKGLGSTTGGFMGGAIGSLLGPIGAFLGSLLGSLFGGELGALFGDPPEPSEATIKIRELRRELGKAYEKIRKLERQKAELEWKNSCLKLTSMYYETLRASMENVSERWTEAEVQAGWRFDLRWFDPNPGVLFTESGKSHCFWRYNEKTLQYKDPNFKGSTSTVYTSGKRSWRAGLLTRRIDLSTTECHLTCPVSYGCQYPKVPEKDFDPFPVEAAFDSGRRIAAAFAARGFYWLEPKNRPTCDALFKAGPETLKVLVWQTKRLAEATTLILLDVERTATAVSTEYDLWANGSAYLLQGLDSGILGKAALAKGVKNGRISNPLVLKDPELKKIEASRNLNKWMLVAGLVAMGAVVIDGRRK